jgi:ABC-type uncharacterized transport system fused permease/ATPase subunit
LRDVAFSLARGEALLIEGPTGAGKSTLLRAIAGIWPFGRGQIRLGRGRMLFVPQRPYLPLGTLASALLYPRGDNCGVSTARLAAVLEEVGLATLAIKLDTRSMLRNFHDQVLDVATFSPRRKQRPAMSNSDIDPVILGCHRSEMAHSAKHSYCPL